MLALFVVLAALPDCGAKQAVGNTSLEIKPSVLDLGTLRPEKSYGEARFSVTNTASVPVEIPKLSSSCGCLDVKLSKKTLQPGESANLDVTVRALAGLPSFTHAVYLHTNYNQEHPAEAHIVGRVDVPFSLFRPELDFGAIWNTESPVERTMMGRYVEKPVVKAHSTSEAFSVKWQNQDDARFLLTITLRSDVAPGKYSGVIIIENEEGRSSKLAVSALVKPRIEVHPSSILVNTASKGAQVKVVELEAGSALQVVRTEAPTFAQVAQKTSTDTALQFTLSIDSGAIPAQSTTAPNEIVFHLASGERVRLPILFWP